MTVRTPVQQRLRVNEIELSVFEWAAASENAAPAPVLFVHATGFHARCWDRLIELLPDVHAFAVDMRGHGRSDKTPPFTWRQFGEDVAELVCALDLTNILAVGHSMGGRAVVEAAAREPQRFSRLILVDPVILAPAYYDNFKPSADPHPAIRRKNLFQSAEQMFQRFSRRPPYSLWQQAILRDYCDHGLVSSGGGFELACPPHVEARIYSGAAEDSVYPAIEQLNLPVQILRAVEQPGDMAAANMSASPTWPGLAARFRRATDHYYPELTHFIPMQSPQLVAQFVSTALIDL